MRCQRHDLALGPEGTCIRCQREKLEARGTRRFLAIIAVVLALSGIAVLIQTANCVHGRAASGPVEPPTASTAPERSLPREGALAATNSAGRKGAFYLPSGYASRNLPLLVAIHGTGGSGQGMVAAFRTLAEHDRFIVVAPDSRIAPNGQPSWQVPDRAGDTSEDHGHIRRCVDEILAMPGVRIDQEHVLVAGHSGGASTAPYEASVDDLYTAFAVLHGGVFAGGLGPRRPRGWLSTGSNDSVRPPRGVREAAEQVRGMGFADVVYREFPEGHEMGEEEIRRLVQWWLLY
jgi:poly(3-hydroxybutyrate) depolymerase